LASDGSYYGTTSAGGTYGQGTVFQVVVDTNCTVTLSAASITLPAKGGSKSLTVKADSDCTWSAVSTNSFITITSGSGTGNGKVEYTVPGNTNTTPQIGTITIRNQTFTVNQDSGGCTFKLSPKSGKIKAAGGTATVKVTPNFSDCDWTAVSNDSFITITNAAGGPGKGSVIYTVPPNTTANVLTGMITIAGEPFTVIQAGVR
jgi:uncharacterized repeat protein (TIGR03803 family)